MRLLQIPQMTNPCNSDGPSRGALRFSRMVKKLDLLESNHGCGLKGLSRESIPKRK